ncbi:putative mitochondrial carrier C4G9.20c [Diplonema papillatum]|nr:putative mitochondrial carrier C4G9.20c [Diplonema papillatum]
MPEEQQAAEGAAAAKRAGTAYEHHFISFAAGAAYGFTSVLVGQPLDTIKTTMQAVPEKSKLGAVRTAADIVRARGPIGLYRGGIPPFVGGSVFRSCQFGAYSTAMNLLQTHLPQYRSFTVGGLEIDCHVILAGMAGGLGRALAEGPADYIKTRQQVSTPWRFAEVYKGAGVTMVRDVFLFAFFAFNMDMSKKLTGGQGLSPFWTGALCANLAWLAIWPLDVVKSRMQSGLYTDKSIFRNLVDAAGSGTLYRGVLPGLLRSTFANGSAMVVYKWTQEVLEERLGLEKNLHGV